MTTSARPRSISMVAAGAVGAGALALGALALAVGPAAASSPNVTATKVMVKSVTVDKYGKILVNSAGLALYYDTANKPGKWACKGGCLTAWPPLTLPKGQKAAVAGPGVTGLGTVKSPSGIQVTWHGKALYTFIQDSKGQVNGQGIGHVWYVAQLSASSKAALTGATTATTSSGSGW